jgi:hypothetical protein
MDSSRGAARLAAARRMEARMGSTKGFAWRTLALALAAFALPDRCAHAAPMPMPAEPPPITPYVSRGMLFGPAQGGLGFSFQMNTSPIEHSRADASVSLAVGLSSRVTLDGSLGTISAETVARYHDPRLGVWVGLVDTEPVEVDVTAGATFGTGLEPPLRAFEPGAAAVFRIGGDARIDASAYLPLSMDGTHVVGLRVPAQLALQLTHDLHFAASTGVTMGDLSSGVVTVPLGVMVGYTVPLGSGGFLMLSPSLTWQRFVEVRGEGIGGPGPLSIGVSLGIVTPP